MGRRVRISTTLLWRYTLFAVVPFFFFGVMATNYLASYTRQEIQQRNQALAQAIHGKFAEGLMEPSMALRQLLLHLEEDPVTTDESLQHHLGLAVASTGYLEALALLTTEGRIAHIGLSNKLAGREADLIGLDLSRQPFFKNALVSNKPTWSDTFLSLLSGEPALAVSMPYKGMVLVGTFNLTHLEQVANEFERTQGLEVDLVDKQGTLIFSSRKKEGQSYLSLRHLQPIAEGIRGKEGNYAFSWDRRDYLGSVVRVTPTGWLILVSQPEQKAFAYLNNLLLLIGGAATIAIGLATLGAITLGRRLSAPLNRLAETASAIAEGHYQVSVPPQEYQELEQFAAGFRHMAHAVEERETLLQQNRAHYQQLFNGGSDAIFLHALNSTSQESGRLIDVNDAACQLLGWSREALLQKTMEDIHPLHDRFIGNSAGLIQRLTAEGISTFESQLLDRQNRAIPVELKTHHLIVERQPALLTIARDIRERVASQRVLHALVESFVDTTGQNSFNRIIRELCSWLGIDGASIGQLNDSQEVIPLATYYRGAYLDIPIQPLPCSPSAMILNQGKVTYLEKARESFPDDAFLQQYDVEGYIGIALRDSHDRNLGVLIAFHSEPLILPPNAQEMFQLLASKAATEIERTHANQTLEIALSSAEEARERVAAILTSMHDGLIVLTPNKRITLMNQAAERLLSLPQEAALNRSAQAAVPNVPLRDHLETLDIENQQETSIDFDIKRPDGEPARTVLASSTRVLNRFHRPTGFITLLRDITREKESERTKSEFIATAAHELKTPLAAIMGFSELLSNEEEFGPFSLEQRQEFLHDIYTKSEFLSEIVDDLLNLGRMESGRPIILSTVEVDIIRLLHQVIPHHERESSMHRFETSLPEGPVLLSADPNRLTQVLDNLLTNAVKYSPDGGTIRIHGEVKGNEIHLRVIDEGIGISADQLDQIFEKFFRASSPERGITGLGLGLSIVKGIVAAHQGEIWAESTLGAGTTIHLTLPCGDPAEPRRL